jgi:hypothetical protein
METPARTPKGLAARTVELELQLVRDAIELVASGRSRRVVVAGLRLGDAILGQAEVSAREAGVRVVPLWTTDEAGTDIAVERMEP